MLHFKRRIMWMLIILCSILALALFPILVNWIMFQNAPTNFATKEISRNSTWIGFFATYFGAVLGGIISGSITLIGVVMTIKSQDRKELINTYPLKRMAGDEILLKTRYISDGLYKNLIDGYYGLVHSAVEPIVLNAEMLLINASKIDGNCYISIRKLVDEAHMYNDTFQSPHPSMAIEYHKSHSDKYREHITKLLEYRKSFLESFSQVVYEYEKTKL